MEELLPGLWRWTARHPEWHPGEFGAEVACFALREGADTLLIDPLVVDDEGWQRLDGVVAGKVTILITIPYHVRSAEAAAARYRASIWGHPACARRLADGAVLRQLSPQAAPAGIRPFAIGSPRRQETPLLIESRSALAFGDAMVGPPGRDGPLRVWAFQNAPSERWYRGRFLPTMQPLAEAAPETVLVTHGPSVVKGGAEALRRALERPAWYHRAG